MEIKHLGNEEELDYDETSSEFEDNDIESTLSDLLDNVKNFKLKYNDLNEKYFELIDCICDFLEEHGTMNSEDFDKIISYN